jgi:hypothetical protein
MAHFHIKTKKGRPYLYVREIARLDGKPKVISQIYIGSPERIAGFVRGTDADVIDEFFGIFITLTAVSNYRFGGLFGFLIFIILDGLKPFPASWIDTNLHGGLGIMMDDLVAGIYALLFLHIILCFLTKKMQIFSNSRQAEN